MPLEDLLDADDMRLRAEVREFCARHLDPGTRARVRAGLPLGKDDHVRWQRALAARGWLTPSWPVADGGTGWGVVRQYLFEEELAAAHAPAVALTLAVGPRLVGPILCRHGTEAQKRAFLPAIRAAEVWWCQGYSEPEAGSDLANLRTTAHRVSGGWRVSGGKTWTSYAHWADRMACLARTDPQAPPQRGVSLLALDMRGPGVTVRPLPAANGRHFFNEVFIDEVFVPDEHLIGPVHGGWGLAKALLEHERLNAARVAEIRGQLRRATALLAARPPGLAQGLGLARLVALETAHRALEALVLRLVSRAAEGATVGPAASMLKLRGTELLQQVNDLLSDLLGAQPGRHWARLTGEAPVDTDDDPERQAEYTHAAQAFYARGFTVAAGTSEVQRNVLARDLLRDPAAAGAGDEPAFAALAQDLDHALPRLLAQAPGPDAAAALARAGWWWPPGDELPLPRPSMVALLGLALGRQGVTLAYPAAVAAAAALEGLPGEPAALALAGLAAGDPGCVWVGPVWQAGPYLGAGRLAGAVGAGAPGVAAQAQAAAAHLRGRAVPLPWTPGAQALLVRTGEDQGTAAAWLLPLTTPGVRLRTAPGPDGLPLGDIEAEVELSAAAHLLARGPDVGAAWAQAQALASLAACAQAVGHMQALVAATARHVQARRQFGQALAQFQAVQHRLVDLHVATEETRALLHATAQRLQAGPDATAVAALAWQATQAGRAVGQGAVQLHGAYAMTAESGIGSRVIALEALLARHAGALAHGEVLAGDLLADARAREAA